MSKPVLTGFADSVYTRAALMGLRHKQIAFDYDEVNPFDDVGALALNDTHPFGRVPALLHGDVVIYETAAVLAYLDEAFDGPTMMPADVLARVRVVQVQGIVDAYAYWPMVRQVYSHGFYRGYRGYDADEAQVSDGLAGSASALDALEHIATEGHVLTGNLMTRADCHLAPMLDSFAQIEPARAMLAARPALDRWYRALGTWPAFHDTRPDYFSAMGGTT